MEVAEGDPRWKLQREILDGSYARDADRLMEYTVGIYSEIWGDTGRSTMGNPVEI
jgi:hypothetical protein